MIETKEKNDINVKEEESTESKESKEEAPRSEKRKNAIQVRKFRPLSLFGNFDRFFDEIDHYFNNIWKSSHFWNFEPFSLKVSDDDKFFRTPLTNITDEGNQYIVSAELPGLDRGDIEITVRDGVLEIKGEQKNEYEDKKEGYVRKEYHSSSYHRRFTVPENIDEEKIDAKLEKGILTLKLPKKEEEKKETKKIEIQ